MSERSTSMTSTPGDFSIIMTGDVTCSGTLEKKGMGIFYRPWAKRQFSYYRESRSITYERDGVFRGAVLVDADTQAKIVNPKEAGGKLFAFEVKVYKHLPNKVDKNPRRLILAANSENERNKWIDFLNDNSIGSSQASKLPDELNNASQPKGPQKQRSVSSSKSLQRKRSDSEDSDQSYSSIDSSSLDSNVSDSLRAPKAAASPYQPRQIEFITEEDAATSKPHRQVDSKNGSKYDTSNETVVRAQSPSMQADLYLLDEEDKYDYKSNPKMAEIKITLVNFFEAIDANSNKKIESNELWGFYLKLGCPIDKIDAEVEQAISQWDVDKDGVLNFKEFFKMNMKKIGIAADGVISPQVIDAIKPVDYDFMMMRIRELTAIAKGDAGMATAGSDRIKAVWTLIRLLFETIDTDFNGFVDKKELRSFYLKMGTPRERVEGLVSEYMGKWGSKLSFEEYYRGMMRDVRAFEGIDPMNAEQMNKKFSEMSHEKFFAMLLMTKFSIEMARKKGPDFEGWSGPGEHTNSAKGASIGGNATAAGGGVGGGSGGASDGSSGSLPSLALAAQRTEELSVLLRELFEAVDENSNGLIERRELEQFYIKIGMPPSEARTDVGYYMGKWRSGLSEEEYANGMLLEIAGMEGLVSGPQFHLDTFLADVSQSRFNQIISEVSSSIRVASGEDLVIERMSELGFCMDDVSAAVAGVGLEEELMSGLMGGGAPGGASAGGGLEILTLSKGERRLELLKDLIRPLFTRVNSSGSGFILPQELRSFWVKTGSSELSVDAQVRNYISTWDADGDEKLSFEEFYHMMRVPRGYKGTPEDLEDHFSAMDDTEFSGILFGLKSITAMVDASFAFSGQARLTELRGLALHLFKTLDVDKDGQLQKSDLKAFYVKMGMKPENLDDAVETFMREVTGGRRAAHVSARGGGREASAAAAVGVSFEEYYKALMVDALRSDEDDCNEPWRMVETDEVQALDGMPMSAYLKAVLTLKAFQTLAEAK